MYKKTVFFFDNWYYVTWKWFLRIIITVTDQLKILHTKIMQNEAQYDLDRKAAKISALSSNNLEKYEYLTDKDLGLKPSTVEQAKFEYFPLDKFLNKELKEEDKKERFLKRLKNIEDKNEELPKALSSANKVSNGAKNESDLNYHSKYAFYKFNRNSKKFRIKFSLDSKYVELKEFYELLSDFEKNHNATIDETKKCK